MRGELSQRGVALSTTRSKAADIARVQPADDQFANRKRKLECRGFADGVQLTHNSIRVEEIFGAAAGNRSGRPPEYRMLVRHALLTPSTRPAHHVPTNGQIQEFPLAPCAERTLISRASRWLFFTESNARSMPRVATADARRFAPPMRMPRARRDAPFA
jgi:hypothetical protein